jgi:hypothetical protein
MYVLSTCLTFFLIVFLDTRVLEEDGKTNRLKDSIACLKDISGNKHLKKIPFQIFLNKHDIYEEIFDKNKMYVLHLVPPVLSFVPQKLILVLVLISFLNVKPQPRLMDSNGLENNMPKNLKEKN